MAVTLPPAGPPVASARRCSGLIGPVRLGNTLRVTVHADRIVPRPLMFLGERTILAAEIVGLGTDGGFAFGASVLTIDHVAPGVRSPVVLLLATDHPVRRAIMARRHGPQDPPPAVATPDSGRRRDWWSPQLISQLAFALAFALAFVGLGCYLIIKSADVFGVVVVAIGGLSAAQPGARAWHRRRHRLSR
jgi:hypothetical protein